MTARRESYEIESYECKKAQTYIGLLVRDMIIYSIYTMYIIMAVGIMSQLGATLAYLTVAWVEPECL